MVGLGLSLQKRPTERREDFQPTWAIVAAIIRFPPKPKAFIWRASRRTTLA